MSAIGRTINTAWLDRQMEVLSLSQVDLAAAAGISQPTVSAALAGQPISPKSRAKLVIVLAKKLGFPSVRSANCWLRLSTPPSPRRSPHEPPDWHGAVHAHRPDRRHPAPARALPALRRGDEAGAGGV